ncbi:MAG: type II toxin-antitoxin system VapC family toxin [Opitutales bacterium]
MIRPTHLLDTNILSGLIRQPRGIVATKIQECGEDRICTSLIVAAEIRYGCLKKGSDRLTAQANAVLNALTILPMEAPADEIYANIRHMLESRGEPIDPNDLLIAAHARSLELTLVSANENEFARVPGLKFENWLAP